MANPSSINPLHSFVAFAKDIKLSHSIFALPFAASALFFIDYSHLNWQTAVLLMVCMVSARSYAMGMNRFLDHKIDAENPRTKVRMIPSGALSPLQGLVWSLFWALILIISAYGLNSLSGHLSFLLLFILGGYSTMKRLSALTHLYLGMCLGLAPIAVAISLTGTVPTALLCLGGAISFWTAGFDILYALQDRDFDIKHKLHSVPTLFSPWHSILISRAFFGVTVVALNLVGYYANLSAFYYCALVLIYALLIYQHWLVRDAKVNGRSNNINAAFFNTNAYISLLFLIIAAAETFFFS